MRRLVLGTAVMLLACGSPAASRSASAPKPTDGPVQAVPRAALGASRAADAPVTGAATSAPAAMQQTTPTPSAQACTFSGAASSPGPTQVVSQAATDDVITFTFDQGVAQFEATPQSTANFVADPSGLPVTLQGSAGLKIVLRGLHFPADTVGPSSFTPGGALVDEVRKIGDFEGVVTWAVGLSAPACAIVTASGSTLTFTFVALTGKGTGKG